MWTYNLERARAAVQFLVDTPYFSHYVKGLRRHVQRPRALPYADNAEALNELLIIGRQNLQAMENLIQIAQYKRSDRNDYQREYMAAKRARDRKVIQLEELLHGRKLDLAARQKLLSRQYEIWNKERQEFLDRHTEEYRNEYGEEPEWLTRNAFIKAFWENKDLEIDALLAEAAKTLDRTVKRKRRIEVPRKQPDTVMRAKLLEALEARRKH